MKFYSASSLVATIALPALINAWALTACGQMYASTEDMACTKKACKAGTLLDFNSGSNQEAVELNIYSDGDCIQEIDHTPGNWTGYELEKDMYSFMVLT